MKINKYIVCLMIFFAVIAFVNISFADVDTTLYSNIYNDPNVLKLESVGSKALGIVQTLAGVIAVISVTLVGIKYIMASPSAKADLKGKLIMVVIGGVILFGGTSILNMVISSFNQALFNQAL